MQYTSKFGIYVNSKDGEVVRINSPYWLPEEPDWVFLTPEVNSTLLQIRDLAKEKGLSDDPDTLTWGRIPLKEEDVS
tara:strand:+ start:242 stop:472 length:231 start_codon:yes stop_codon:yes gene_type:complete